MRLFVLMDDATQRVCPVEANSPEEAREKLAKALGRDVSDDVLYDADDSEDIQQIISIVARNGA